MFHSFPSFSISFSLSSPPSSFLSTPSPIPEFLSHQIPSHHTLPHPPTPTSTPRFLQFPSVSPSPFPPLFPALLTHKLMQYTHPHPSPPSSLSKKPAKQPLSSTSPLAHSIKFVLSDRIREKTPAWFGLTMLRSAVQHILTTQLSNLHLMNLSSTTDTAQPPSSSAHNSPTTSSAQLSQQTGHPSHLKKKNVRKE